MKRAALAFILALTIIAPVAGLAVAETPTATPTPTPTNDSEEAAWTPPGPFDLTELRTNGRHPSEAPMSVRQLGDPVRGSVAVRYIPSSPVSNEHEFLEPGTTLQTDTIQFYSTAYSDAVGEYEVVIVFWQHKQKTVNGTTFQYAANQSVQRATVDMGEGYDTSDVRLESHYDARWQATMWLERNGERVDGARWRFKHASVPASQQIAINTRGDAWRYLFINGIVPGIGGIIGGLALASATLRRTGRGPGYGMVVWGLLGGVSIFAVLGGLYYEVTQVVAHMEVLMGASLSIIAYGGGLRMHNAVEKIGFERMELTDALPLRQSGRQQETEAATDGGEPAPGVIEIGDSDYKEELYEDLEILPTIRDGTGSRLIPKQGIRPFLARLFANAAELDISSFRTRVRMRDGPLAEKIYVNPDADSAVEHTRAHLRRKMPFSDMRPEDSGRLEGLVFTVATLGALGLPVIGWYAGQAMANVPVIGAAVGLVGLAILSYEAVDGSIEVDPAPLHSRSAKATLTALQKEFADAKLLEEYEEIAWSERTRSALEARDVEGRRDKSMLQRMNEGALGMGLSPEDQEDELDAPEDILGGPTDEKVTTDGGEEE